MKNSKAQTITTIGIGFIIIGVMLLVYSLSQPKVVIRDTVSNEFDTSQIITSESEETAEELEIAYPLNLNTCTYEELLTVEGIGESKATLILDYRDYLGGYTSVEQLKDINGISNNIYEKIAPYFTV